jgi:hypothetical protein
MGIEKGKKVQAKGKSNISNKIIAGNFPKLKTEMQEASRTPDRHDQIEPLHGILYLKY